MKFQNILLAFFGVVAVVAVAVFSVMPTNRDASIAGAAGNVSIWGTFPLTKELGNVVDNFNAAYEGGFSVSYEYHDPATFDNEIVEALASGRGPDILLIPDDLVLRHSDKVEFISYQAVPSDVFRSSFVQAAEIYLRAEGLLALPFAIDPLVMYWNRDLFNNASITEPPRYWDELLTMAPRLTKRDPKTSEITQSAVPFGEYGNVIHAKDIIAMLFLQVGNPIVAIENGRPMSKIVATNESKTVPSQDVVSALRFFMDFSNPQKLNYTWSRARQNSLDEFINGNLAIDFDYASAYKRILEKNPHLNFDVAAMPLPRGTRAEITFTKVYGLSVLKSSRNKQTAQIAVQRLLADMIPERDFASAFGLPPVIRSYLSQRPTDAALATFYDAAIRGRTWLDPKPEISDKSFRRMIESVASGRNDVQTAIIGLHADISSALADYQ
ncbi:MAG: extracellular solute-binding protein [Patescibacteria group bacterium]